MVPFAVRAALLSVGSNAAFLIVRTLAIEGGVLGTSRYREKNEEDCQIQQWLYSFS